MEFNCITSTDGIFDNDLGGADSNTFGAQAGQIGQKRPLYAQG